MSEELTKNVFVNASIFTRNCVTSNSNVVSSSLHPERVMVYAGLTSTTVLPPFLFKDTIDGDGYLDMLRSHVISFLRENDFYRRLNSNRLRLLHMSRRL